MERWCPQIVIKQKKPLKRKAGKVTQAEKGAPDFLFECKKEEQLE